jgi:hypothetical protein
MLVRAYFDGESACRRGSVRRLPTLGWPSIYAAYQWAAGIPEEPGGRAAHAHIWPCSGWGLPSYPGLPGHWCALTAPFHPCLCDPGPEAGTAIGGLFSVALSVRSPCQAVSQHPALRSPDLPRPGHAGGGPPATPSRGHLADSPSRSHCAGPARRPPPTQLGRVVVVVPDPPAAVPGVRSRDASTAT